MLTWLGLLVGVAWACSLSFYAGAMVATRRDRGAKGPIVELTLVGDVPMIRPVDATGFEIADWLAHTAMNAGVVDTGERFEFPDVHPFEDHAG